MPADPTFAAHARDYFRAVAQDHRVVTEDDARADDRLSLGHCLCADDLADGLPQHLLDKLAEGVAVPPLAPHVVHVEDPFEDLPDEIVASEDEPFLDADGIMRDPGDPRPKGLHVKGRRYIGPTDCPDCRRGLTSRGSDFVCLRLSRDIELRGCHEGCVVACGEGLTDV